MSATPSQAAEAVARPLRRAAPPPVVAGLTAAPRSTLLLYSLLVFFVLEYARPPAITPLRLQFLISSVIPLAWLAGRGRPWSPLLTCQLLFFAVNVVHTPFVLNNFASYMTARGMYGNFAIALGLAWGLSRRDWFKLGAWTWVVVMGYDALYGLTHGGVGPGGFVRDENDLALGCASALGFCLFGFGAQRGLLRWASALLAALFVAAIVASLSRGGFLAMLAVGFVFFLGSRHKARDLGVVMIAAALLLALAPKEFFDEMYTIKDTDKGTAEKRQFLWAIAYRMWEAHPVVGVGGGNFPFLAGDFQPTDGNWPAEYFARSSSGTVVHSLYFQLLSEQGLVGVALLLWLVVGHFRTLHRVRRLLHAQPHAPPDLVRDVNCYTGALAAAAVGFLGAGAFISTLYYPYLWYFGGMTVALDAWARRELAQAGRRVPIARPGDGGAG